VRSAKLKLQRLNRLLKKSSSTATLGCVPLLSAAKSTQPRVAVLLNPAVNGLFPQPVKPHSLCRTYVVAKATTHDDFAVFTQTIPFVEFRHCKAKTAQAEAYAK
jgi:hypothetical protein